MRPTTLSSKGPLCAILIAIQFISFTVHAQMRQLYVDADAGNQINKISFYSPGSGFVAFADWIGFTTDSGRTYVQKPITLSNVNYNGYSVNLTFGFDILGVKAFNQNTLIVYGDYGLVPAILYSTDGGNTFTLIFQSQYNPLQLSTGITAMIFPQNDNIGFAVDADRILKTTDQGLTWTVLSVYPGSFFDYLEAVDDNHVYAFSLGTHTNKLLATTNSGASWQQMTLPAGSLNYACFISANSGWANFSGNGAGGTFYTSNAGATWTQMNNSQVTPFSCIKMSFINDSTGYATAAAFQVFKTSDSGKIWEQLPRDNSFTYLGYSFNDLQYMSNNQLWAGGGHGFLELGTSGGGVPLPGAFFRIDTAGLSATGSVSLVNYSKTGYTYQWLVNGSVIGSSYNISYTHNINRLQDSISLIVSNGVTADTTMQIQFFYPPVIIRSVQPDTAAMGARVTIKGLNFSGATFVSFGGVPAGAFTVASDTLITATVGSGASGNVFVGTPDGTGQLSGFIFIPAPLIDSFTPRSAIAGSTITIDGIHFTGATAVNFGGTPVSSFTVLSDTVITAIPASGSTGAITVISPGGTAILPGFSELPNMTSFMPSVGSNGMNVTISGTGFEGTTAVTFGGIAARFFTLNSSTSLDAVVGPGAAGNVVLSTASGTSSLAGFTYVFPPVITAFAPASGAVGAQIVISGSNFGPTPADNTVYFGAVKAVITAASSTSLSVTVPAGATYAPVSVTTNQLTAYTTQPFVLTFPDGGSISPQSFASKIDFTAPSGGYMPGYAMGDIDGDGKPDIAMTSADQSNIFIARNTSTPGSISYVMTGGYLAGYSNNVSAEGYEPQGINLVDIDGDGRNDMVILSADTVVILINTSTPGHVSFAPPVRIGGTANAGCVVIADVDGDGRPDLITVNNNNYFVSLISVSLNNSSPGAVFFSPPVNTGITGTYDIHIGDIDQDGRPDLVVINKTSNFLQVVRNTSSIGNVSFVPAVTLTTQYPSGLFIGDVDGDGQVDIGATNADGNTLSIFRNNGSHSISFDNEINFPTGNSPGGMTFGDVDGDGKPDIVVANLVDSTVSVFKNISSPGHIALSTMINFTCGSEPAAVALCDMDGDGKNDIEAIEPNSTTFSVLRNVIVPEPFIQSFTPGNGITGTQVTISGSNFTGVTAVSFGGVPATSFTINSANSITAVVGGGASGTIAVTNSYGACELPGFTFGIPPVISAVTPVSGAPGTAVTITGSNFNSLSSGNIVYFGAVKAIVISATANTLVVTVPVGATYSPISVTAGNLTAYSTQLFLPTFAGTGGAFTASSFAISQSFPGGGEGAAADFDGDGKTDLVYVSGSAAISALRNTSSPGTLSFTGPMTIATGTNPDVIAIGDLDGDGRPDVVTINSGSDSISVLQNTSTPGSISFGPNTNYATGGSNAGPEAMVITDIDGDGRPDVVVVNYGGNTMSVFRNITKNGVIALDTRLDYALSGYATGVTCSDFDGDGKTDIAIAVNLTPALTSVFRNTSTPGMISFATRQDFITGENWPGTIKAGDVDGDGMADLAIVNSNSSTLTILRNTSVPGSIAFAPKVDYSTDEQPTGLAAGDLNGDGKPDFATNSLYLNAYSSYDKTATLLGNHSTPGTIALQPAFIYPLLTNSNYGNNANVDIADMDGDGMSDVILYGGIRGLTILRNRNGEPPIVNASFTPSTAYTGQTVTIRGTGLTGTTGVSFGGVPAQSFAVLGDTTVRAIVGAGASGNIVLIISGDSTSLPGFTYLSIPSVTSLGAVSFCAGGADTLQSSNTYNNQWYKNGVLLNNDTANILLVRDSGVYSVATSLNGVTTPAQPGISISVTPIPPTPVITASSNGLLSSADSGNQWYMDTTSILSGANGQLYKPSVQGYYAVKVTVDGCTSPLSASYEYTPPAVTTTPAPNDSIHISPNPATSSITITFDPTVIRNLNIELSGMSGNLMLIRENVQSGGQIDISLLAPGLYVIRMQGQSNNGQIRKVSRFLKL